MPSLPLLGTLIDTVGSAIKAARNAGTPDAAAARDAAAATRPFARTLQHSVETQNRSGAAGSADSSGAAATAAARGAKPSASSDSSDSSDNDATAADSQPDAAALAAAVAVQAQLQARPDAATPATNVPSANAAARPGEPAVAAASAEPATSRDVLHAALAKLTGGASAVALPATGSAAAAAAAPASAAPLTPKLPTFDKTLADAKGALAAPQAQAAQPLPADVAATSGATAGAAHALATTQDAAAPAQAELAAASAASAASAAAQPALQASPVASSIAAANANTLAPHVGTADWTDALSQKVVFLSNAHQQSAELTLNPPDLGPLQVVLRVADNHAHALFVSQHAQVRDAVEAALPKLRDAMEAGGLGLGSATVSDGGFASQQQNPQQTFAGGQSSRRGNGAPSAGDAPGDDAQSVVTVSAAATASRVGLVDTFA